MLRRNHMLTIAALAASALPVSSAVAQQDLRPPDARDAAQHRGLYEQDAAPQTLNRDYGSPDAADAAQHRGPYEVDSAPQAGTQDLRSPDARDAARDLPPVHIPAPTVEVREVPSDGFSWGDAGIGAAGMLALLGIGAGSTLLITSRRRRRGFEVATR
jgi:hypothetical protein